MSIDAHYFFLGELTIFIKSPGIYILGKFLSKLKNREEFEGGLEKRKGKEEKKEKSDKTHVNIVAESANLTHFQSFHPDVCLSSSFLLRIGVRPSRTHHNKLRCI